MNIQTETTNKDIFEIILQCLKKEYPPQKTTELLLEKYSELGLETIVKFVCDVYNVKTK
jgi:hypothetical protein